MISLLNIKKLGNTKPNVKFQIKIFQGIVDIHITNVKTFKSFHLTVKQRINSKLTSKSWMEIYSKSKIIYRLTNA